MEHNGSDSKVEEFRTPPYSKEAEDSIIGAILLDNNVFFLLGGRIDSDDFYVYANRLIFDHIKKLVSKGKPADVLTVFDSLKQSGLETETGGLEYLNRLSEYTPGSANVLRYAEILRDRSIRRRLVSVGGEIATDSMNAGEKEAKDLLDEAQAKVMRISEDYESSTSGFLKIDNVLANFTNRIKELSELEYGSQVTGVSTGFTDLDRMTTGLHEGELIIIAGRPAMGKTAFALNIASHVAVQQSLPVAIFSLEMTAEQLSGRLVSARGQINQNELKTGQLSDWKGFYTAVEELGKAPIFIDETGGLSILNLRSRARQLLNRLGGKLGLIVVDYIQLMTGEGGHSAESRANEIAEISRGLKSLAKELKVPVVALSQIKREVDNRTDKRPLMSDLRESGSIEQDADLILFVYREGAYRKDKSGQDGEEGVPDDPNAPQPAEIIIGKQRSGPTGIVNVVFQGIYTRFVNAATPQQESEGYC